MSESQASAEVVFVNFVQDLVLNYENVPKYFIYDEHGSGFQAPFTSEQELAKLFRADFAAEDDGRRNSS